MPTDPVDLKVLGRLPSWVKWSKSSVLIDKELHAAAPIRCRWVTGRIGSVFLVDEGNAARRLKPGPIEVWLMVDTFAFAVLVVVGEVVGAAPKRRWTCVMLESLLLPC